MNFSSWFAQTFVFPWWLLTTTLLLVGMAYRAYRVVTADEREVTRRKDLVAQLHEFIGGALRGNIEFARQLLDDKFRLHAQLYIRGQPVSKLLDVSGIGTATVETLRNAGLRTLGDVLDRDIRKIKFVGESKFQAAWHYIRVETDAAYRGLVAGEDIPRDPRVEAEYTEAINKLGVRNDVLEQDSRGLQPASDEIAAYQAEVAKHTSEERLRAWLRSPLETLKSRPTRPLRFALLGALFVGLAAVIPVVLRHGRSGAGLAATAAAFFAAHFYFVVYAFLSDRSIKLGTRALNPENYQEQRLQYLGLKLSLAEGIAPPEVRITEGSVTQTLGHRRGPSLIALPTEHVQLLAGGANQSGVEFLIAHEIGSLSSDQMRLTTTARLLVAPFAALAHATVQGFALAFAGFPRVSNILAVGLLMGCCCLPAIWFIPLGLGVLATYMAVAATQLVVSADVVFESDRLARRFTSTEAMKATLSTLADHKRESEARRAGDPSFGIDLLVPPEQLAFHQKAARFVNSLLDRAVRGAPSLRRRLKAIDSGSAPIIDLTMGAMKAGLMLAVAVVGLAIAGVQIDMLRARFETRRHVAPPPASLPLAPPPPHEPIRFDAIVAAHRGNGCNIRSEPSRTAHTVAAVMNGARCRVLPVDDEWSDVVCGTHRGFMGTGCLQTPTLDGGAR